MKDITLNNTRENPNARELNCFKYVSEFSAVSHLLRGKVRFTPPSQLNDPCEAVAPFDITEVINSLNHLRKTGYTNEDLESLKQQGLLLQTLNPKSMLVPPPRSREVANALIRSTVYDQSGYLEEALVKTIAAISSKIGLLCLTESSTSLPMWAYYANRGAGAVVQFQGLNQEFPGDETGMLHELRQVIYYEQRPSITFHPRTHRHLYYSKLSDWAFERESRVAVPLSECRVDANNDDPLYLYQLQHAKVCRIIFGWRVSAEETRKQITVWREIAPTVKFEKASFDRDLLRMTDLE